MSIGFAALANWICVGIASSERVSTANCLYYGFLLLGHMGSGLEANHVRVTKGAAYM